MVTLNKNPLGKDFGILCGDYRIPAGQAGSPFIKASATGAAIKFVEHPTQEILGRILARFKVEVNKVTGTDGVFAKGFNDQILKSTRTLDTFYTYIRDNARRLAVRRAHPEFFRRVNALKIGDKTYQAYGNFQLLDCPFKEQVVIHRADSPETLRQNRDVWLYTAANGGILVSPFISQTEKAIRAEAEEAGGRFILVTNEPMGERYKPTGREFSLCEAGRLLIVSANLPGVLSRINCLAMNALAALISKL